LIIALGGGEVWEAGGRAFVGGGGRAVSRGKRLSGGGSVQCGEGMRGRQRVRPGDCFGRGCGVREWDAGWRRRGSVKRRTRRQLRGGGEEAKGAGNQLGRSTQKQGAGFQVQGSESTGLDARRGRNTRRRGNGDREWGRKKREVSHWTVSAPRWIRAVRGKRGLWGINQTQKE